MVEVRRVAAQWIESIADRLGTNAWPVVARALAVVAAGIGAWWAFASPAPPPVETILPSVEDAGPTIDAVPTSAPATIDASMVVHVDGAVRRAGVHELMPGARVVDAVEAAGGLDDDADRERLNLAALVSDGQRVWVPRIGETEPPVEPVLGGVDGTSAGAGGADGPLVDLNRADLAGLETLPGVGPSIAAAIIRHREESGPYERVDDLLEVAGIGPSRFAQIEPLVTV